MGTLFDFIFRQTSPMDAMLANVQRVLGTEKHIWMHKTQFGLQCEVLTQRENGRLTRADMERLSTLGYVGQYRDWSGGRMSSFMLVPIGQRVDPLATVE